MPLSVRASGFFDVRILVCFDCVGTNRYCHWRLEQRLLASFGRIELKNFLSGILDFV